MKIFFRLSFVFSLVFLCNYTNAQDTILKQNKEIVIANVIEVSSKEVKYKRYSLPDGPVFTVSKAEITKIKYVNGTIDEFNKPLPQTQPEPIAAVKEPQPIDTTRRYILTTLDGTQLKGEIISQNEKEIVFKDNNFGERKIKRSSVKNISLENGEEIIVVTLNDGTIITGKVINKTEAATVIESQHLGTISIPSEKIKSIREFEESTITDKGKIWFQNPNCSRYLFAPSAIQLKKGEGYYQNIYGAGNAFNFGVHKNVTIGGGLVGPMGVYLNAKAGGKLGKLVHLGAGFLIGNSFFQYNNNNLGMGLGFGVLTIGNYDHNITVGAGYGFMNIDGITREMEKPLFVANGMARLGKKYALVTENWITNVQRGPFDNVTRESHYDTFFSYAFRYMGEKSTLDVGFLNTPGLINKGWWIGIPYIGFVVRFGKYKDE